MESTKSEIDMHKHCMHCFNKICVDSFEKTCPLIPCLHGCGMMLHSCKVEDHKIICFNLIQPCINSIYGCPFMLRRSQIGKHLSTCPASCIVCTMEWNRRPLHLEDTMSMKDYDPNSVVSDQLEAALALKDQRVLLEAMVPCGILKQILKYNDSSQKVSFPFMTTNIKNIDDDSSETTENTKKFGSDVVSKCDEKPNFTDNSHASNLQANSLPSQKNDDIPMTPRKPLLRSKFRLAPKKEYADASCDTSDLEINCMNMNWMNPGLKVNSTNPINSMFEMIGAYEKREAISNPHHSEGIRCAMSDVRLCSFRHVATQTRPFFDMNKHNFKIGNALQEVFNQDSTFTLSSFHSLQLYETLALNQVMECLPRYERKTRSTYTFMCNNLFRRDQFQSHFQNVHSEIYSNLNGWLEEKCPYSQYGCRYSQFRFLPDNDKNKLVFDNQRSCLTVKTECSFPKINSDGSDTQVNILSLPWEIQERILYFLDSYSIGQLLQTCKYFKNFCVFHLKECGIVSLNWEKFKRIDGSISWQSVDHTWHFSNSFSPVKKWVFNNVPSMCHHINKCLYATTVTLKYPEKTPVKLLCTIENCEDIFPSKCLERSKLGCPKSSETHCALNAQTVDALVVINDKDS